MSGVRGVVGVPETGPAGRVGRQLGHVLPPLDIGQGEGVRWAGGPPLRRRDDWRVYGQRAGALNGEGRRVRVDRPFCSSQ